MDNDVSMTLDGSLRYVGGREESEKHIMPRKYDVLKL